MEIFSHTFVNAHIIGCSPVHKIDVNDNNNLKLIKYYYQFDLYTTGGLHQFKSEIFNQIALLTPTQFIEEELKNHNIKVTIWKEAADTYINFIESLNPSNYDNL